MWVSYGSAVFFCCSKNCVSTYLNVWQADEWQTGSVITGCLGGSGCLIAADLLGRLMQNEPKETSSVAFCRHPHALTHAYLYTHLHVLMQTPYARTHRNVGVYVHTHTVHTNSLSLGTGNAPSDSFSCSYGNHFSCFQEKECFFFFEALYLTMSFPSSHSVVSQYSPLCRWLIICTQSIESYNQYDSADI